MIFQQQIQYTCKALCVILLVLCVVLFPTDAMAQSDSSAEINPQTLEIFVDEFVEAQMVEEEVPGVSVAIVHNGEMVLLRGYGYADIDTQTPVDPTETPFRVASITKPFTALAVMQLVEQGVLDLHTDVNQYLEGFQIPSTFAEPITLHHLLTHTAGFDQREIGLRTVDPEEVVPIDEYVKTYLPPRVYAPGELIMYSNYGIALVGYIIERVSGMPYQEYVTQYILQPLAMSHSGFVPTPAAVIGYEENSPVTSLIYNAPSIGGLYASAVDMSHFMLALLQNGSLDETQLLQPATTEQMLSRQFAHHPALNGVTCGFFERTADGRREIWHNGALPGFSSMLTMLPEDQFGVFISHNDGSSLHDDFPEALFDHFFPVTPQPVSSDIDAGDLTKFVGTYTRTEYERHTSLRLQALTNQLRVSVDDDMLMLRGDQYIPEGPLQFRQVDGNRQIAFRENSEGEITHLFIGIQSYEQTPSWSTLPVTLGILMGFLGLFFVPELIPRLKANMATAQGRSDRFQSILLQGIPILVIVILTGMFMAGAVDTRLYYGTQYPFQTLFINLVWVLVGVLGVLAVTVLINVIRTPGNWRHWYAACVTVIASAFCVWLSTWNLLGAQW